jgi:hypothetical protein
MLVPRHFDTFNVWPSVADPHQFAPYVDAAFHFDADPGPDSTFHSVADPDLTLQFNVDQGPDPSTHFLPDLDPPMRPNDPLRLQPFYFDADPDPGFHFDVDPDPAFHFDADPDTASQNDADPYRNTGLANIYL